jgi:hypothetical protein
MGKNETSAEGKKAIAALEKKITVQVMKAANWTHGVFAEQAAIAVKDQTGKTPQVADPDVFRVGNLVDVTTFNPEGDQTFPGMIVGVTMHFVTVITRRGHMWVTDNYALKGMGQTWGLTLLNSEVQRPMIKDTAKALG